MIALRIKELRSKHNMTQRELADKLSLTPKMISFYELGQRMPPNDILIKLASIFDVPSDYLLGITDTPETQKSAPDGALDDELWELRREMAERDEMKVLFDLARGATKEDVELVNDMLKRFSGVDDDE